MYFFHNGKVMDGFYLSSAFVLERRFASLGVESAISFSWSQSGSCLSTYLASETMITCAFDFQQRVSENAMMEL